MDDVLGVKVLESHQDLEESQNKKNYLEIEIPFWKASVGILLLESSNTW